MTDKRYEKTLQKDKQVIILVLFGIDNMGNHNCAQLIYFRYFSIIYIWKILLWMGMRY